MERKTFRAPMELKQDGQPGEFRAVFATLNVTDHDKDVTIPGAFIEQDVVVEPWNHGWTLPAGMGKIRTDENEAWIEGVFFLDTEVGRDNYLTVKNLGPLAEWSYTFDILEATPAEPATMNGAERILRKMDVVGVSPVTRGAGINTRTVDIKGQKRAIAPHSTATSEGAWDGPANEARLRNDGGATYFRRAFAWVDPEADPETKAAYKFIHHEVTSDGEIGAANVRACQTGIGVLNGGRGGTTIPEGDRQGVYNHLARHLRDADVEPPALKSLAELNQKDGDNEGEIDHTSGGDKPSDVDLLTRIDLAEMVIILLETED